MIVIGNDRYIIRNTTKYNMNLFYDYYACANQRVKKIGCDVVIKCIIDIEV